MEQHQLATLRGGLATRRPPPHKEGTGALPASSFKGQIKTTAEQVIKQEIMNSITVFSVSAAGEMC